MIILLFLDERQKLLPLVDKLANHLLTLEEVIAQEEHEVDSTTEESPVKTKKPKIKASNKKLEAYKQRAKQMFSVSNDAKVAAMQRKIDELQKKLELSESSGILICIYACLQFPQCYNVYYMHVYN